MTDDEPDPEDLNEIDVVYATSDQYQIYPASTPTMDKEFNLPGWVTAALARTSVAHTASMKAAEVMAATAVDLCTDPDALSRAWEEYEERTGGDPMSVLLPEGAEPPVELPREGRDLVAAGRRGRLVPRRRRLPGIGLGRLGRLEEHVGLHPEEDARVEERPSGGPQVGRLEPLEELVRDADDVDVPGVDLAVLG
jgi:hypothetical protein